MRRLLFAALSVSVLASIGPCRLPPPLGTATVCKGASGAFPAIASSQAVVNAWRPRLVQVPTAG